MLFPAEILNFAQFGYKKFRKVCLNVGTWSSLMVDHISPWKFKSMGALPKSL